MMINSMLNPADSLTPILHFPYVNSKMEMTCYYCNEAIAFNKNLNRYVGDNGIRCPKMCN
jgi:hypothetical protein